MGAFLSQSDYQIVKRYAEADIIVINTCSVTGATEAKNKRLINSLSRKYPDAKLLLTGCLAQQIPEELQSINGVAWVVGNRQKKDIPKILAEKKDGVYHSSFTKGESQLAVFSRDLSLQDAERRTRFSVKVQEGCDFRCTYCIVPILRGPSRSGDHGEILATCRNALDAGYKEIVITGTHIGQYASGDGYNLEQLIRQIINLKGDFRVRLSSLDPRDCTDGLLELVSGSDDVCRHLHISMQSLSPAVIQSMGRDWNGHNQFISRISEFMNSFPDTGLGADFIVGFPGETEDQFEETCFWVKKIGFNYGHVFRYSKRPGTPAAVMDGQIPEKVKARRSDLLRRQLSLQRKLWIEKQLHDRVHTIIIEREKPVRGLSSNYIRCEVPACTGTWNSWQNVSLHSYNADENICTGCELRES